MSFRHVLATFAIAAGCSRGGDGGSGSGSASASAAPTAAAAAPLASQSVSDPLRDDLDRICNAMTLSGAEAQEGANRTYVMATWLDANVASDAGRAFLVQFASLGQNKEARVALLETTMRQVGLPACPLVAQWQ